MNKNERIEKIKEIEERRNSKLICYITGDRGGFETGITKDVINLFYEHLLLIGNVENIDLLIYSTGGDTLAAFAIVKHLREFCEKFSVLIPYKALSAATLIAIGADEIYMTKLGELSPVDSSVTTPYNPTMPNQPPNEPLKFLPVNMEEVTGYINLAKHKVGLKEEISLNSILQTLSQRIHPLSLGSVYRAREQVGMLAKKLLEYHLKDENDLKTIINTLTKDLYSHDYLFTRSEVKESLKLNVIETDIELEKLVWELYKLYTNELELDKPFSPEVFLGSENNKIGDFKRVYLESIKRTDIYITKKRIKRTQIQLPGVPTPQSAFQEELIFQGWTTEKNN